MTNICTTCCEHFTKEIVCMEFVLFQIFLRINSHYFPGKNTLTGWGMEDVSVYCEVGAGLPRCNSCTISPRAISDEQSGSRRGFL
jgi:hypothetical protein